MLPLLLLQLSCYTTLGKCFGEAFKVVYSLQPLDNIKWVCGKEVNMLSNSVYRYLQFVSKIPRANTSVSNKQVNTQIIIIHLILSYTIHLTSNVGF